MPTADGDAVFVTAFKVSGSRFDDRELSGVLAPFVNKRLGLSALQEAVRKVTEYYRERDLLAAAYLPAQTIRDGVVAITVVEGKLGKISIDPSAPTRLDPELAIGIVARRTPLGEILSPGRLDEAVGVLNDLPGVKASSVLQPGEVEGETDVLLVMKDKPVASGSMTLDNGGSPSTGEARSIGSVTIDNASGLGERYSASTLLTTGTRYARLAATVPVGYSGLSLGVYGSALGYEVGGAFRSLKLNGYSWTTGANAAYPLVRGGSFSLTASASIEHKRFMDFADAAGLGDKSVQVGSLGLSATLKDELFGGGDNNFGVTLSAGNLDLSGNQAALQTDQATARANGLYSKLTATLGREQPITDAVTLAATLTAQATRDNLDSSEKLSLGGSDGIRAYPSGEASGDLGVRLNLEARWQLTDALQLATFYDIGMIRQHSRTWLNWQPASGQPNNYVLHGVGVSASWSIASWLTLKGTLAAATSRNDGRTAAGQDGDGRSQDLRGWVQLVGSF